MPFDAFGSFVASRMAFFKGVFDLGVGNDDQLIHDLPFLYYFSYNAMISRTEVNSERR